MNIVVSSLQLRETSTEMRRDNPGRIKISERNGITYGSLVFPDVIGKPHATVSYKSSGSPQSPRRRICTSVNGDNRACARPLLSTTLTLIDFMARSSSSALGRSVLRPG